MVITFRARKLFDSIKLSVLRLRNIPIIIAYYVTGPDVVPCSIWFWFGNAAERALYPLAGLLNRHVRF